MKLEAVLGSVQIQFFTYVAHPYHVLLQATEMVQLLLMLPPWDGDIRSNIKDSPNGLFLPACDLYRGYNRLSWKQQWEQPAVGKRTAEGLGEQPPAAPDAHWQVTGGRAVAEGRGGKPWLEGGRL